MGVELIIDQTGNIQHTKLVKRIGGGCDEESLRVVKEHLNNWLPGKIKGVPVATRIYLPVKYRLE